MWRGDGGRGIYWDDWCGGGTGEKRWNLLLPILPRCSVFMGGFRSLGWGLGTVSFPPSTRFRPTCQTPWSRAHLPGTSCGMIQSGERTESGDHTSSDTFQVCFYCCRQDEIDPAIEQYLQENQGFIENFARGTAHMFRLVGSCMLVW